MVDIKKYYNDRVIFNICESSTTGDLNYAGLLIPIAKLDTNICRRLTEFGFMWFAEDAKLPNNIAERFHSMVINMKAFILASTEKKGSKGSK